MDYIIYEKVIAIIFSLCIFGQAYMCKRIFGTYIHPAAMFALIWFFYTIIPLLLLFSVPVNAFSVLFVFCCVLGFTCSSFIFGVRGRDYFSCVQIDTHERYNTWFLNCLLVLVSSLSVIFSTLSLTSQGFRLSTNMQEILSISGEFAALRGNGLLNGSGYESVFVFLTYSSAILSGLVYTYKSSKFKRIIVLMLGFCPALYIVVTQSSKLILFFSIGFYFASILLVKIHQRRFSLLGIINYTYTFLAILCLIFVSSFSILSRDKFDISGELYFVVGHVISTFSNYAFAQIYAFSDFFSFYLGEASEVQYASDPEIFGYYTFKGAFDMFGQLGFFDVFGQPGGRPDITYYSSYNYNDEVSTNIFTIFRGLLYDFGMLGSICVMFIFGVIANSFFYLLLNRGASPISGSGFLVFIIFVQGSYLFSIFSARYALLIFVVFSGVLFVNDLLVSNKIRSGRRLLRVDDSV